MSATSHSRKFRVATLLAAASLASTAFAAQSQSISFGAPSGLTFVGQSFNITAKATSGLPVTFSTTTPATCAIVGAKVTARAAGSCVILAAQPGDANFSAAPSVSQSFTLAATSAAGRLFTSGPVSTSNIGPFGAATGDFNGDGKPDVAVTFDSDSTVRVYLGDGTGTLGTVTPSFYTGSLPVSVAVGDFNGDNKQDLAIADTGTNSVSVYLGDGFGGFTAAPGGPIATGAGAYSVTVGDFNTDGILDLAVSNSGANTVSVLLGSGTGTFTQAAGSPYVTGSLPFFLTSADLNGDGNLDLIIASYLGNTLDLYWGNGAGGFTPAPFSPLAVGANPFGIAAVDLNGDGVPDLAATSAGTNSVTVMLATGTGSYTPAAGSPFATGGNPLTLITGDFNGDGFPDLATPNFLTNNVTVLLGSGTGAFSAAPGSPFAVGTNPRGTIAGDFNGDGRLDLFTTNHGAVSATFLLALPALTTSTLTTTTPTITLGASVPLTLAVTRTNTSMTATPTGPASFSDTFGGSTTLLGTAAQTASPYTFSAASLAAGVHSITATYGGNTGNATSTSNTLVVTVNKLSQTITFAALANRAATAPFTLTATASSSLTVTFSSATPAVCTVSGTTLTLLSTGTCTVQADQAGNAAYAAAPAITRSFTVTQGTQTIGWASPTGIKFPGQTWTQPARATSALPVTISSTTPAICSAIGATIRLRAAGTCTLQGTQAGNALFAAAPVTTNSFTVQASGSAQTLIPSAGSPFSTGSANAPFTAAVSDQNGDGALDVAIADLNAAYTVLMGNSAGGLSFAPGSPQTFGSHLQDIVTADFTSEGYKDLAILDSSLNRVTIHLGNGSGAFTATPDVWPTGGSPTSLIVGDFNRDGNADLATSNAGDATVTVLLGDGAGHFEAAPRSPFRVGASPANVATGDLNGDGNLDLVTVGFPGLSILLGDGSGSFVLDTFSLSFSPSGVALADLNLDGNPDLAVSSASNNTITVLLNQGFGVFSSAGTTSTGGSNPLLATTGDFNGDGYPDLAVPNYFTNNVAILLGNGTGALTPAPGSPYAVGTSPRAAVPGDFNNDGKLDLVITNSGDHTVTVLLGGGPTATISRSTNFQAYSFPVTFTVNVATAIGVPASGTVSIYDGQTLLGVAAGTTSPWTFTTSSMPVGTHTMTAVYDGGAATGQATSNALDYTVIKGFQAIHWNLPGPTPVYTALPVTPVVDVASNLPIVMSSQTPATCSVSGTVIYYLASGNCQILSTQAGDTNWNPTSLVTTLNIQPVTQTLTFGAITGLSMVGHKITSPVISSAGLSPTLTSNTPAVCTASGIVVNLLSAGTCTLRAAQAGNGGATAASVTRSFTVAPLTASGTFAPASGSPFATGTNPFGGAIGDFNNDGNPDAAIANIGGNTVTILLGNGTGGFTPASGSPFAAGTNPGSLAVGDFNADGKQDLAITNEGANAVTILLGNGAGGFTPASGSPLATGSAPNSIAVGDFTGDGNLDLVVTNSGDNAVALFFGNGSGGFTPAPATLAVGLAPYFVTTGDLNGDGNLDIVTANFGAHTVTVLLGNGAGAFTPASGSPFATGVNPFGVIVADLNQDGKQDLAISNAGSQNVTVLLNNGAASFTQAAGSPFAVEVNPLVMATGDFNGDGFPDLAVPNYVSNNLTILLGNGTGSFTAAPGGSFAAGTNPRAALTADFNGDGRLDLLTTNVNSNTVTLLLGSRATSTATLTTTAAASVSVGTTVPLSLTLTPNPLGRRPSGAVAIFDQQISLGTATGTQSPYTFTTAALTAGAHSFTASYAGDSSTLPATSNAVAITATQAAQTITFAPLANQTIPAAPLTLTATASSGLAVTFTSLTTAVCAVSGNQVTLLAIGTCSIQAAQTGNGSYLAATPVTQSFTVTQSTQTITFGAASGSAFVGQSLIVPVQASSHLRVTLTSTTPAVCTSQGAGVRLLSAGTCTLRATQPGNGVMNPAAPVTKTFTVRQSVASVALTEAPSSPIAATVSAMASGDFNGDGLPDLITSGPTEINVLLNNGAGGFTAAPGGPSTLVPGPNTLSVADLNGDGKLDVVVRNTNTAVYVLLGTGTGQFVAAPGGPITAITQVSTMTIADLNTDGIPDLLIAGETTVLPMLGDGTGAFTAAPAGSAAVYGNGISSIAVGDVNGDGFPDLAIACQYFYVNILLGDGAGGFTPTAAGTMNIGLLPLRAALTDFNHDGKLDLVVARVIDGGIVVFTGDGTGAFTPSSPILDGAAFFDMATADLNGDGYPDLAVGSTTHTRLLIGNATGVFTPAPGALDRPDTTHSIAADDFNGDGRLDLVTVNPSQIHVLFGSATTATSAALSTTAPASVVAGTQTPLTLTVSAAPGAYTFATGSVTITDTLNGVTTTLGTAPPTGGAYSITPTLPNGVHTLAATFTGSGGFLSSTSNTLTLTVTGQAQTITFAPLTGRTFGTAPFTVTATASSQLPVTFTSQTSAVCAVSGATVTLLSAGSCTLRATQPGNTTFDAAPYVDQTFTVAKATPVLSWPAPASILYGSALGSGQLRATTTVPGTFVYTPAAGAVLPVGTQTLSVTFTPTDSLNYNPATATTNITITAGAITPASLVVTRVMTRSGNNIVVQLTIANTGGTAAANVTVTTATLGGVVASVSPSGTLPKIVGGIAAGASSQVTLLVPGTVGTSGASSSLVVGGTFTGGTFSSSARVTLP